jgi:hypothetical protein
MQKRDHDKRKKKKGLPMPVRISLLAGLILMPFSLYAAMGTGVYALELLSFGLILALMAFISVWG